MSDTLNDRTSRAFEKIKGWSSLKELNDVEYVDISKATKKRTFFDNFDSWMTINHPRISFITFILVIIHITVSLYK